MDINIAQNRFGLGTRPDGAGALSLMDQIAAGKAPSPALTSLPKSGQVLADYATFAANKKDARLLRQMTDEPTAEAMMAKAESDDARRVLQDHYRVAVRARFENAVATPSGFAERLVHFWSNHFAISGDTPLLKALAGPYEQEAIRPHVFGRFADMLGAVIGHPAMLIYLDQWKSVGPNSHSLVALRDRGKARGNTLGLNENLAREILELHTMGVRSGYSQDDVRQLALALTGRTIAGINGKASAQTGHRFGTVYFDSRLHEPGIRTILGQSFLDHGEGQAIHIVNYVASLPQTAHFLATKLARHFVADDPPADLVKSIASAFQASNGDLSAMYRALIAHKDAWSPSLRKFTTPWQWAIAAHRSLDMTLEQSGLRIETQMANLGQAIWTPKSPAGFPDVAEPWLSPSALMRRAQLAHRLAQKTKRSRGAVPLEGIAAQRPYSDATLSVLKGAPSVEQLTTLALMAPEFLRR